MGVVGGVCFFLLVFMFALPGFAPAQDKYPAKSIITDAAIKDWYKSYSILQ